MLDKIKLKPLVDDEVNVVERMIFSSTDQKPASYCHGIVSLVFVSVCSSVHVSLNSSFKKLFLRN